MTTADKIAALQAAVADLTKRLAAVEASTAAIAADLKPTPTLPAQTGDLPVTNP